MRQPTSSGLHTSRDALAPAPYRSPRSGLQGCEHQNRSARLRMGEAQRQGGAKDPGPMARGRHPLETGRSRSTCHCHACGSGDGLAVREGEVCIMSGGDACKCGAGRPAWVVVQRRCNRSAFNGYRKTPSDYSQVRCCACHSVWRTKAAYVDSLPDGTFPRYPAEGSDQDGSCGHPAHSGGPCPGCLDG